MAVEERIGDRIRRARRAQGLTLAQVGEYLGVTPSAVQQWERGSTQPSIDRLSKFAALANTPVAWLVDGQATDDALSGPELMRRLNNVSLDTFGSPTDVVRFASSRHNNNAPMTTSELQLALHNLGKTTPADIWQRAQYPNSLPQKLNAAPVPKQPAMVPGSSQAGSGAEAAKYSYVFFDKDGTLVMSRLLGPAHDPDAITFTVSDDLNGTEFQVGDVLTFHPKGNVSFGSIILVEIKNAKAFIGEIRPTFPGYEQFGICVVAKSYWDHVVAPYWDSSRLFDYVYWLSPGDKIRGGLVEHVRPLTPKETANEAAKIEAFLQLAVHKPEAEGGSPFPAEPATKVPDKLAQSHLPKGNEGQRSGNTKHRRK